VANSSGCGAEGWRAGGRAAPGRERLHSYRLETGELRHDFVGHIGGERDTQLYEQAHHATQLYGGFAAFDFADEYGPHAGAAGNVIQAQSLGSPSRTNQEAELGGGFEFYLHEIPFYFDAIPSILNTKQAKVNKTIRWHRYKSRKGSVF